MKKMRSTARPCPCGSGAAYRDCCRRFHKGEEPDDPETLVRSRFSAFALGEGAYVARTAHPEHAQSRTPEEELSRAPQRLRYQRLVIHEGRLDGDRALVLFTAGVFEKGRDRSFVELSTFERVDGAWRYREGVTRPTGETPPTIDGFERHDFEQGG